MTTADQIPETSPLTPAGDACAILDAADGLDRMMGDSVLYTRLLARFRADYGRAADRVRAALAAADSELAQRHLHTLKGAAGMIGAHRAHQRCDALESALRAGANPSARDVEQFSAALAELLDELDRRLAAAEPESVPATPASTAPDPQLLARLAALLSDGNGAALDLIEESGATLEATMGTARWEAVSAAAHQFDFEGALEALGGDAGR